MANRAIRTILSDGRIVATNIVNKSTGEYMEIVKIPSIPFGFISDNEVFFTTSSALYGIEYWQRVYSDFGQVFLEKDTMTEMRDLSSVEIVLLRLGRYKGVRLNGYYTKGDTPTPIDYFLSNTLDDDDRGSTIVLDNIKLKHVFVNEVHSSYFGISEDSTLTPLENKEHLQYCFDIANKYSLDRVYIGKGIHEIDTSEQELRYRNSNSELIFEEATLKLSEGSGRLSGTQLIMFLQCSNVIVRNMSLDGNRDNVIIREDDRGRQFSFSAYEFVENLHIIGGKCINAAQNHMQNTSEGLIIDGMTFDTSGEHSLYLTLATNNPRKSVIIKNCKFHRWAIDFAAVGISLRDYRYGLIENCIFDVHPNDGGIITNVEGGGAIQTHVEYDSTLGANETLKHLIKDCTIINHPDFSYSVNGSKRGTNGTYIEGGYLERPTATGVIQVKGVNINITSAYRWENNPEEIVNCTIRCRGLWPTSTLNFEGNKVYSTNQETGGTVLSLQTATSGSYTIKNNEFHNFTEDSTSFGLIRGNTNCTLIVDGNILYNCSSGRFARLRSTSDIAINNKNMNPELSAMQIRYDVTPRLSRNNSMEPVQGPSASRPSFGSSTVGGGVGHEYFDTDLGKPIYWNGTNWVDATGTNV